MIEKWEMRDPMLVLQKKQEREARSKASKSDGARKELEKIFKTTEKERLDSEQK